MPPTPKRPKPGKAKPKRARRVPKRVGISMRKWREASGLSLEQVGTLIGKTKGHLSGVETGKGNMSLPVFIDFCNAVGVPACRVLEDSILAKHEDVDRLTADLVHKAGLEKIQWLAELDKPTLNLALTRADEAVAYSRAKEDERDSAKAVKAAKPRKKTTFH